MGNRPDQWSEVMIFDFFVIMPDEAVEQTGDLKRKITSVPNYNFSLQT